MESISLDFFYSWVLFIFCFYFHSKHKWGCKKHLAIHVTLNWKHNKTKEPKTLSKPWGLKITSVSVVEHPSMWRMSTSTSCSSPSCYEMQMPIRDILTLGGRKPPFWDMSPVFYRLSSFPTSQYTSLCNFLLCIFRFYLHVSLSWFWLGEGWFLPSSCVSDLE